MQRKGNAGKEKEEETNKFSRLPTFHYLESSGLLYICLLVEFGKKSLLLSTSSCTH